MERSHSLGGSDDSEDFFKPNFVQQDDNFDLHQAPELYRERIGTHEQLPWCNAGRISMKYFNVMKAKAAAISELQDRQTNDGRISRAEMTFMALVQQ